MSPIDHPITRRFIEDAGNTTQALGVGRVIGQIFAYLYFSEESRTLDDMKGALGISKGSASMGVRQLEQWGAVQRVWVKGDRKDFYTANDYFGQIVRVLSATVRAPEYVALLA
jgi:DNA-binding transcriptional regulator GbsR (MarR family)